MKPLAPLTSKPILPLLAALGVLCVEWFALPVPPLGTTTGPSQRDCLTLADRPDPGPVQVLERCAALVPSDAELLADLAAAYEAAGRPADAEAAYRRALSIDPDFADVRHRLASLLAGRGAMDEARQEIDAALRVQPNRGVLRRWPNP